MDADGLVRSHPLHRLHTIQRSADRLAMWQRGGVDDKDRSESAQALQAILDAVDRGELTAESPVEQELPSRNCCVESREPSRRSGSPHPGASAT